jgi:hypothetical protein
MRRLRSDDEGRDTKAELNFPDNSFNSVICVEAALHFNTREKFLREAWRVDLERICGIKFDDTLLNHEHLRSIRSAAALMHSLCAASEAGNREGVENRIEP